MNKKEVSNIFACMMYQTNCFWFRINEASWIGIRVGKQSVIFVGKQWKIFYSEMFQQC